MNYTKIKKIGEGSFGTVNLAKQDSGKSIAIKEFKKTSTLQCEIIRELNFSALISHPNCVDVTSIIIVKDGFNLVMEYAGVSLRSYMSKKPYKDRAVICFDILKQITQGLYYLHKNNIYHRDIKPDNILILDNKVKICDFGHCIEGRENNHNTPDVCNKYYKAPELFSINNLYDSAVDIWSLGCTMYEFLLDKPLFKGNELNILESILRSIPTSTEDLQLLGLSMIDPQIINTEGYYKVPNIIKHTITDTQLRRDLTRFKKILDSMLVINPYNRVSSAKLMKWLKCPRHIPIIEKKYKILKPILANNKLKRQKALEFLLKYNSEGIISDVVFFKALAIIDYLCEVVDVTRIMIYASLNLSSKYHDIIAIDIMELQEHESLKEITSGEIYIIRKLKYKMNFMTIYNIIPQHSHELVLDRDELVGISENDLIKLKDSL